MKMALYTKHKISRQIFVAAAKGDTNESHLTLGGPIIIPVQCVRVMSSSFSKPQLMVPSPTPFCPCSSSSSRRKFRGTTATCHIL